MAIQGPSSASFCGSSRSVLSYLGIRQPTRGPERAVGGGRRAPGRMTLLHVHVCGLFCCPNHLCPARWLDASHYRQYNATECPFRHQTVTAPVSGPAKARSWLDERQPALPGGPDQPRQRAVRPLPDLLDALVNDRGRVAAAEALGVNYRSQCPQQTPRVCFTTGATFLLPAVSGGVVPHPAAHWLTFARNRWSGS